MDDVGETSTSAVPSLLSMIRRVSKFQTRIASLIYFVNKITRFLLGSGLDFH